MKNLKLRALSSMAHNVSSCESQRLRHMCGACVQQKSYFVKIQGFGRWLSILDSGMLLTTGGQSLFSPSRISRIATTLPGNMY